MHPTHPRRRNSIKQVAILVHARKLREIIPPEKFKSTSIWPQGIRPASWESQQNPLCILRATKLTLILNRQMVKIQNRSNQEIRMRRNYGGLEHSLRNPHRTWTTNLTATTMSTLSGRWTRCIRKSPRLCSTWMRTSLPRNQTEGSMPTTAVLRITKK